MAEYFEQTGLKLLSNSSDPDVGDVITLKRVGVNVGALADPTYPQNYALTTGSITVLNASGDAKAILVSDASNPADGVTAAAGTIVFTVQDNHGTESASHATATINLRGQATSSSPQPVFSGLIANWKADAGVTLVSGTATTWVDQIGSLSLTATGTPTQGTPIGGSATATMVFGDADGFTGTTLTGFPSAASARTVSMVWKVGDISYYGGFGWGANANNQAFTLAADDSDELSVDYKGSRVTTGMQPRNEWVVVQGTYDGTTIKIYIGEALVASSAVALSTGTSLINVMRSFSGFTTQGEIGEVLVYGRELDAAERLQNIVYLNSRFIGSSAVPDPAQATATGVGATSFTGNVTVNSPYAVVAWSARSSSTAATEAQILAGTGAISYGIAVCNGTGTVTFAVTGGTASTNYYVNTIVYGITGGKSAVVKSAAIATTATPGANPVLSSAGLTATGQTTATGAVTSDTGNGTLYYGLMLSSATTPNATQLKAGTDGDSVALIGGVRTQAITASGAQAVAFTALTAATAYKVAYYQENASAGPSNIVTATDTTDAATVTTSYSPDAIVSTAAALNSQLATWAANWNGTTPGGKTNADKRVIQLDTGVPGFTISEDFTGFPGVIVRGIGPYGNLSTYPYYGTSGAHISGTLTLSNCVNVEVYGLTCQKLVGSGCTGLKIDRVSVHPRNFTTRQVPTASIGIDLTNCPGAVVTRCHTGGFKTASVSFGDGCDDATLEKTYMEQYQDDLFKCRQGSATLSRVSVLRNWAGRDNLSGAAAHSDFNQNQSGATPDYTFYGNVCIEGAMLNNVGFQGGMWGSNTNVADRCNVQQNIFAARMGNAINTAAGANDVCQYNTLLYAETGAHGSVQLIRSDAPDIAGAWATKQFNFACRKNTGSADTSGTGGIVFTTGDTFGNAIVATVSGYSAYFQGFPGELTGIESLYPVLGSVAHWSTSGQKVGAYLRAQEIFETGIHPGNDGWPTAARFHAEYDPSNTLGSGYNGTYDDDGNNTTAAPTVVTIDAPLLEVYDSDPHGVDAARITFTGTHDQDGSALQIRIVRSADSVEVVTWADFTAGAGGTWTTSVDVPRGWNGLKAVVRAKNDVAVTATQSSAFYSGYIVGGVGQSLVERPISTAASTASLTPPAKTLWIKHNSATGSASAAPAEVTSASNLNLRRMACAVAAYSDAPICFVVMAESGTGLGQTVNAEEVADRSWFGTVETPVKYIQDRGSDLSIFLWHWFTSDAAVQTEWERWVAPALIKQSLNSLADTPDASGLVAYTTGSVQVVPSRPYTPVHFFFDLNGTGQGLFDETRTRFVPWYGHSFMNFTGDASVAANDLQKAKLAKALGAASEGTAGSLVSLANVASWTGQTAFGGHLAQPAPTHVGSSNGEEDGEALVAVYMAIAYCRAVGALHNKEPQITAVTDNTTYWDVTVSLPHGGNLSTALIEHTAGNYAGSFEATNWQTPTATTESDIAQLHAVQGFTVFTGSTPDWTNFTAVVQNTGTGTVPTRTGVIRVTPSGGTAGKTLAFGYGAGYNLYSQSNANASRVYTHMPLETRTHVSGTGYGYPVVRQAANTVIVPVAP